jgi:glycosyltransferase involved in cell wall biosynthesis
LSKKLAMRNLGIVAPIIDGGIRTHLEALCPLLERAGYNITVITSREAAWAGRALRYRLLGFPSHEYSFMPGSLGLMHDMESHRWDLLHVHGYPNFMADWLTLSRRIHGMPIVLTPHGSVHQFTSGFMRRIKTIHNAAMSGFVENVGMYIAVSEAERTAMLQRGFPSDRVRVVRNGVSQVLLDASRSNYLREKYGQGFYVAYVGRLSGSKNVELLPGLMERIQRRNRDIKLIVAGEDYGKRVELERQVAQMGLADNVTFLGWLTEDEKLKVLTSADVFVHPSLQDVASLGVMEAEASGTPAVAFDTPGNAEMIIDDGTGILATRDDPPGGLADAILGLAENESTLKRMGKEAKEYASTHFTWEASALQTAGIYEELAGKVS